MSKTSVKTLFGDREVVFVEFPIIWTGEQCRDALNWAKTYDVVSLHDSFIIKCYVKPHYFHHFERENKTFIIPHTYNEDDGIFEVDGTLYE